MKSSYELAMERLAKSEPVIKLTAAQKKALAELDSRYAAKTAELEISLNGEIEKAAAAGEFEKAAENRQRLTHERQRLQAELAAKKEQVRKPAKA